MRAHSILISTAILLLAGAAPSAAWRRVPLPIDEPMALAAHPETGRVALGDARGVRIETPGVGWRRVPLPAAVRDLAFDDADGTLWVASDQGVRAVAPDGSVRRIVPAPGEAVRDTRRIATAGGVVVVSTGAGVHLRTGAARWQLVSSTWPEGEGGAVALRWRGPRLECWAVIDARLWRAELERRDEAFVAHASGRVVLADAPAAAAPVDIALGAERDETVFVLPDALMVRSARAMAWRITRPALAPGARFHRLLRAPDVVWLATDRGLWQAPDLAGAWQRAVAPLGARPIRGIAFDGVRTWAVDSQVLHLRAPDVPRRVSTRTGGAWLADAARPSIGEVHRRTLAHLSLDGARIAALRAGVARRGWLPQVDLHVGWARDRDRDVDHDDAFVSGETRHLIDRSVIRRRDFEAGLALRWQLGDVAYHPEQIDVAKEARDTLRLRDDVLDEVNQLYFERLRVIASLRTGGDALAPDEALRLRLRRGELEAGLDAWTGGWFARAAAAETKLAPTVPTEEEK